MSIKRFLRTVTLVPILFLFLAGLTYQNGLINWAFLDGDYSSSYDSDGIPLNLSTGSTEFTSEFFQRMSVALPEKIDVRLTNPNYITDDAGANINVNEDAEVFVTFLHEGAGYKNSIGMFLFDTDSPPTNKSQVEEVIFFPNSSYPEWNKNGLNVGDTVNLGLVPAGKSVGFVVVANGWNATSGVKPNMNSDWVFYTLKDLNSELDPTLRGHTVLLHDESTEAVILGMEDIKRDVSGCDHDFNDVLLAVTSNPPEAINTSVINKVPDAGDRDGDGVLDGNDEFPDNPNKAFTLFYPSKVGWGTLAFEDRWPSQGDYDLNDVVLEYHLEQITNAPGHVVELQASYKLLARGANLHSGFGVHFPGITPSSVISSQLAINDQPAQPINLEAGQSEAVVIVFDNAHDYTQHINTSTCPFYNTLSGCITTDTTTFVVTLTLDLGDQITISAPYNPFIFRTYERGTEIHLAGKPPTDLANSALFQTQDDNSNISSGIYYLSTNNLPWAIDVPDYWEHPLETVDVLQAYPDFQHWAESGGINNRDWFVTNKVNSRIFQ